MDIVERMQKRVIRLENSRCVSDSGPLDSLASNEEAVEQVHPSSI
jgi:hypothetical protein